MLQSHQSIQTTMPALAVWFYSICSLPQLSISIPTTTGPTSKKRQTITFSVLDCFKLDPVKQASPKFPKLWIWQDQKITGPVPCSLCEFNLHVCWFNPHVDWFNPNFGQLNLNIGLLNLQFCWWNYRFSSPPHIIASLRVPFWLHRFNCSTSHDSSQKNPKNVLRMSYKNVL